MKKILLFLCIAAVGVSCVDDDYDLSKVNTNDITIGGEGSIFEIPLATVTVSLAKLGKNEEAGISEIYDEAEIWLPGTTPDGKEYFDIPKLVSDRDGYLTATVDLLCDQMGTDIAKRNAVAELIGEKYADDFDIRDLPDGVSVEQFIKEYYDEDLFRDQIAEAVKKLAQGYLSGIQIDPVSYEIPPLDISSDIFDMLSENLDDKEAANPKNVLYIFGEVNSSFAVDFEAAPSLANTIIAFDPFLVTSDTTTDMGTVRFFREDLDILFHGTMLDMPIEVRHYYPGHGFEEGQTIKIKLSLRKLGGLKI